MNRLKHAHCDRGRKINRHRRWYLVDIDIEGFVDRRAYILLPSTVYCIESLPHTIFVYVIALRLFRHFL